MYQGSARKVIVSGCFVLFTATASGVHPLPGTVTTTNLITGVPQKSLVTSSFPVPGGQVVTSTDSIAVPMELYAPELLVSRVPDATLSPSTYLVADVAVEADYAFYQKLGSDLNRAQQYVRTLLGAVSSIYQRDAHIVLNVSFIRISTSSSEYWTATDTNGALDQVQAYWLSNESTRARAVVLFLSGKNLGGGVAYLPGICSNNYGYAVVGNLSGNFTSQPSQSTWDLVSTAHELGHTFGSQHSHCYTKASGSWYDRCYSAESGCYSGSAVPGKGTIMSYCHVTNPYMANIDPISFIDSSNDPVMANAIRSMATNRIASQPGGCLRTMLPKVYVPLADD